MELTLSNSGHHLQSKSPRLVAPLTLSGVSSFNPTPGRSLSPLHKWETEA